MSYYLTKPRNYKEIKKVITTNDVNKLYDLLFPNGKPSVYFYSEENYFYKLIKYIAKYGCLTMLNFVLNFKQGDIYYTGDRQSIYSEILVIAAERGHLEKLKYYLRKTAHPNYSSVFERAVINKQKNIIEHLLSVTDITKFALLEHALAKCNVEMFQLILSHQQISLSPLVLGFAISNGNLELVQFLLNYKKKYKLIFNLANISHYNLAGAVHSGNLILVKFLIDYHMPNNPHQLLKIAAYQGHLDIVKYLINLKDRDGYVCQPCGGFRVALTSAIINDKTQIALHLTDYFCKNGIFLHYRNLWWNKAVENYRVDIIKYFVEFKTVAGNYIFDPSVFKIKDLVQAVRHNKLEFLKLLLQLKGRNNQPIFNLARKIVIINDRFKGQEVTLAYLLNIKNIDNITMYVPSLDPSEDLACAVSPSTVLKKDFWQLIYLTLHKDIHGNYICDFSKFTQFRFNYLNSALTANNLHIFVKCLKQRIKDGDTKLFNKFASAEYFLELLLSVPGKKEELQARVDYIDNMFSVYKSLYLGEKDRKALPNEIIYKIFDRVRHLTHHDLITLCDSDLDEMFHKYKHKP